MPSIVLAARFVERQQRARGVAPEDHRKPFAKIAGMRASSTRPYRRGAARTRRADSASAKPASHDDIRA